MGEELFEFGTMGELVERAIAIEKEAALFYHLISEMFPISVAPADVLEFFRSMEADEHAHAAALLALHESMSDAQLNARAESKAIHIIRKFLRFSGNDAAAEVITLDDAYRLTIKLEYSELNKLYELLVSLYGENDPRRHDAIMLQKQHMDKITRFKGDYDKTDARASIRAKKLL